MRRAQHCDSRRKAVAIYMCAVQQRTCARQAVGRLQGPWLHSADGRRSARRSGHICWQVLRCPGAARLRGHWRHHGRTSVGVEV